MELTPEEVRVLGVLVEKEATTPDQYPLSTNALTNACNQKTSRNPVVDYDQRTVADTMLLLRPAGLARTVISGRTEKHRHVLDEAWGLDSAALSVLAVLMLRGPQSPGELRTRTERAHGFESVDAVEVVLRQLSAGDAPFVRNLGRGPGQSQDRWTHLVGAIDPTTDAAPTPHSSTSAEAPAVEVASPVQRPTSVVDELEQRVASLEHRLETLEQSLGL